MVNCHIKMFQRRFFVRNREIDSELKNTGIMQVLKGAGNLNIVGTTDIGDPSTVGFSIIQRIRRGLPSFWHEARVINTFSLYLFVGFA